MGRGTRSSGPYGGSGSGIQGSMGAIGGAAAGVVVVADRRRVRKSGVEVGCLGCMVWPVWMEEFVVEVHDALCFHRLGTDCGFAFVDFLAMPVKSMVANAVLLIQSL